MYCKLSAVQAWYLDKLPAKSFHLLHLACKADARRRRRRWCPAGATIHLCIDTEQQPNSEKFIRPFSYLDALVCPKPSMTGTRLTRTLPLASYLQLFDRHWQDWNLAPIEWRLSFETGSGRDSYVNDFIYFMGGTRVALIPTTVWWMPSCVYTASTSSLLPSFRFFPLAAVSTLRVCA